MKGNRLYIKIFLVFLILVFLTEVLIFTVFRHVTGRPFAREFEGYVRAAAVTIRDLAECGIRERWDRSGGEQRRVSGFLAELARPYGATLWLTGADGSVLARSSAGPLPPAPRAALRGTGAYRYAFTRGPKPSIYAVLPVLLPDRSSGLLHLSHAREHPRRHETRFLLGLSIIGVLIALVLYPLTLYITNPLKQLTAASRRISSGDLEGRVVVTSGDEIGELAAAFNVMAEKIRLMVKGTRELTANISHELRSPLARMRVALELLSERLRAGKDGRWEELVRSMEAEIGDMDRLIGQILKLSHLEMQREYSLAGELDLAQWIKSALERFAVLIDRKELRVTAKLPPSLRVSPVNSEDIAAALTNLIDNAVKYTPGGGELVIECGRGNGTAFIVITNTVAGAGKIDAGRMFDPFTRYGEGGTAGSGLGGAIARSIARRHGGDLTASLAGGVLRVTFTVPGAV